MPAAPNVYFFLCRNDNGKLVWTGYWCLVSVNAYWATYERIIDMLIHGKSKSMVGNMVDNHSLSPLDDPQYHYELFLGKLQQPFRGKILGTDIHERPIRAATPENLISGSLVIWPKELTLRQVIVQNNGLGMDIGCIITVEKNAPLSSDNTSLNWDAVVSTIGNLFVMTASAASIIQGLDVVERRWRERRAKLQANPQHVPPVTSKSEIVHIRLNMSDGTRPAFKKWLDDPDALKTYIDAFNDPSSSVKPLQAVFVPIQGRPLVVDVSKGTKDNLQLEVLLSYLNTDKSEGQVEPGSKHNKDQ